MKFGLKRITAKKFTFGLCSSYPIGIFITSTIVVEGELVVCADGPCVPIDQCHLSGVCDPKTGNCGVGAAVQDGTGCDDGNACTIQDTCESGVCTGLLINCTAKLNPDQCHSASCNAADGYTQM